jgi:hypothetical protein
LQIHLDEAFFSDDRFLDSLNKSLLNEATLLNREFTVPKENTEASFLQKKKEQKN